VNSLVLALQDFALAGEPPGVSGRPVLVAALVVGIVAAAAWMLRRRLPSMKSQDFAVERALSLGERRTLVIVLVENRRLLLGMTPQQLSFITELQGAAVPAAQAVDHRAEARAVAVGFEQELGSRISAGVQA